MPLTRPIQVTLGVVVAATIAAAAIFAQPGLKDTPPVNQPPASPPAKGEPGKPAAVAPAKPTDTIRFGIKAAPAKTPGAIRITSFNVENLFDDHDDPALSGNFEDKASTKAPEQLKAAADAIRALDCDVLCLQEVESERAVKWFRDNHLQDMGYDYVASMDAGDPRGIEQAVLSRFPISNVRTYNHQKLGGRQPDRWGNQNNPEAGSPFEFKRSPLQVTVEVPNTSVADLLKKAGKTDARAESYKLTLFVIHLKSGRDYDAQRAAEAGGVAKLVQAVESADPRANVLILGDCNATLNQGAFRPFDQANLPTIFKDRNPQDRATMTHTTARCIDHILYNANVKGELVMGSRFVLGMPARGEKEDWRTTPAPAGYASDHYPVSIDLTPVDAPQSTGR